MPAGPIIEVYLQPAGSGAAGPQLGPYQPAQVTFSGFNSVGPYEPAQPTFSGANALGPYEPAEVLFDLENTIVNQVPGHAFPQIGGLDTQSNGAPVARRPRFNVQDGAEAAFDLDPFTDPTKASLRLLLRAEGGLVARVPGIDFMAAGVTPLWTADRPSRVTVLYRCTAANTVTDEATVRLSSAAPGDVAGNAKLLGLLLAGQAWLYSPGGSSRVLQAGDTLSLEVVTPATALLQTVEAFVLVTRIES